MTQYRALLVDPGRPTPDRAKQTISMSLSDVEDWAIKTLVGGDELQGPTRIDTSDRAYVQVFVTQESFLMQYDKTTAKSIRKKRREERKGNETTAGD